MVERGRVKLTSILCPANLWAHMQCGRERCLPCKNAAASKELWLCGHEGVTYTLECDLCKGGGLKAHYHGQTGRCAYLRGLDHEEGMRNMDREHPLVKHYLDMHPGEEVKAKMKVKKRLKTALNRQVSESVMIGGWS